MCFNVMLIKVLAFALNSAEVIQHSTKFFSKLENANRN